MSDPVSAETVIPFRRNYGTDSHPCSVPPPIGPQQPGRPLPAGEWPEGAEPLGDDWEPI
jgi:hypothetical protein